VLADAIVLLGCRLELDGEPTPVARRRVTATAEAFRQGRAPRIVTTGGRRWGPHAEARALRTLLVREGIPDSAIVEELWSLTTLENACFATELLKELTQAAAGGGPRQPRVVLASCSWHLPRAQRCFEAAGAEVVGLAPAPHTSPDRFQVAEALRSVGDLAARRQLPGLRAAFAAHLRTLPVSQPTAHTP
jgi:uncharacterized SAM-binding protein YcdF (DUF218 family)